MLLPALGDSKKLSILPSHPIVRASLYLSCMLPSGRTGPRTESDQGCPTNPASVSQSRGPGNERYCRWALTSPHRTVILAADNTASLKIITRGMTEIAAQRSADNR